MRTIKQYSYRLTDDKWQKIFAYASLYAKEKDKWLIYLHSRIELTSNFRQIRTEMVKEKYAEKNNLPSALWKTALDSACKQMDMYWKALFVEVRKNVNRNANLSADQKKHCYMILRNYSLLGELLKDKNPESKTKLDLVEQLKANRYLARTIRKKIKYLPRTKLTRSFTLDVNAYSKCETNNNQYVKLTTLEKGKRVTIPLKGYLHWKGKTIDVVMDKDKQSLAIHYSVDVPEAPKDCVGAVGINTGYSEVFVDSTGRKYGADFGDIMTKETEVRHHKGIARNKLFQLANRHEERGNTEKAQNIRRNNLGRKKLEKRTQKKQAHLESTINHAINQLRDQHGNNIDLVCEKMGSQFTKTRSRPLNRKLSAWVRGVIKERLTFKTCQGYKLTQLNPAYISMTCPDCGHVDAKNKSKSGNDFECQSCGVKSHIDWVAAKNILSRLGDADITEFTPVLQVKKILTDRYLANC